MKSICRTLALVLTVMTLALAFVACTPKEDPYAFITPQGIAVDIGQLADVTVANLGTPLAKSESASCGGIPGNDCIYTYAGFRVKTTPSNSGDVVCQIEFTDDSVETSTGIYIGMKAEDAKATMGDYTPTMVGENMVYEASGVKLQINVRDGYVTGVLYIAK